jgi:hypothetical protein
MPVSNKTGIFGSVKTLIDVCCSVCCCEECDVVGGGGVTMEYLNV